MKYDILQVLGMVGMGVTAATGIRLLVDRTQTAWLAWLPGDPPRFVVLVILLVLSVALTTWAHGRAAALGRR